jgi:hypothetical protein
LLVDALRQNKIEPLPSDIRNQKDKGALLKWVRSCGDVIGDSITMKINEYVQEQFGQDVRLQKMSRESQSLIELSWAARANFLRDPDDYVFDAGLYGEHYPCQVRYIRTSDSKIVAYGETGQVQSRLLSEHVVPVFEAAVFGDSWDSMWAKMPEVAAEQRAQRIAVSFVYCSHLFKCTDLAENADPPNVRFRFH